MKPSNGESQSDEWDESCKDAKEKQNIVETLRWYDEQIAKPQSWNFTRINTIKNFIIFETNDYRVEGPFFERDAKKDGIK